MTTIPIKTATASDQDQTIASIVLAFTADPMARWSYTNPHEYLRYFPEWSGFWAKAFEPVTLKF